MNKKPLSIKIFIVAGNLILSITVIAVLNTFPTPNTSIESVKSQHVHVESYLVNKGLEKSKAQKLITKNANLNEPAINMLAQSLGVQESKLYEKIAQKLLFGSEVDLLKKQTLISLAQSVSGGYVSENTLKDIYDFSS